MGKERTIERSESRQRHFTHEKGFGLLRQSKKKGKEVGRAHEVTEEFKETRRKKPRAPAARRRGTPMRRRQQRLEGRFTSAKNIKGTKRGGPNFPSHRLNV